MFSGTCAAHSRGVLSKRGRRSAPPTIEGSDMNGTAPAAVGLCLLLVYGGASSAPDYSKRAQALEPAIQARLIGKWTNPVDSLVIEISSVDLASGQIRGKVSPTTGPAAGNEHELIGWVNAGPPINGKFDTVIPVTFSTTLYEYGTLPAWAGYLREDKLVTMHYLVWPTRPYPWDHISAFQETWTRLPGSSAAPAQ